LLGRKPGLRIEPFPHRFFWCNGRELSGRLQSTTCFRILVFGSAIQMSGRIRRNLNAALKTIQEYTAEANRIIAEENDEDTRRKLKLEKAHIETTIVRIEELDAQWSDYVASLEGPQKMSEESLYLDFPPRGAGMEREEGQEVPLAQRHFVDQCEFARQVVVLIEQTMEDLG